VNRRLPSWCDTCRRLIQDPYDCCPDCGGELIRFRMTHVAVDPVSDSTWEVTEEP
jgi:rRNA maturation endonuclease Nob1